VQLNAADVDWNERLVRVLGKGKRTVGAIGDTALAAISNYWKETKRSPAGNAPVFLAERHKAAPLSTRMLQSRLKNIWRWPAWTRA